MFDRLGPLGILGLVVIVAGIAIISLRDLVIAGGIGLVVAGVGLVAFGMVRSMLSMFGMR
jgi:drug/metabolite transporter (DMT)-like permease